MKPIVVKIQGKLINDRAVESDVPEHRHMLRCPDCGAILDKRDLVAVILHEESCSGGRQVILPEE